MRLLFITFFMFSSLSVFAKSVDEKDRTVEKLFDTIEVNLFISEIEQIKKYQTVEDVEELDYKLKRYFDNIESWYFFNHKNFKNGLKRKLKKSFSNRELNYLNKTFKKPFLLKVLNASVLKRDLFKYNSDSVDETYSTDDIVKSRYTLIANIYTLFGMEIQKEKLHKKLKDIVDSGKVMLKVLGKNKQNQVFVDPVRLERRLKNPKDFIVKYFAGELKTFRHYELREFIRKFKRDKTAQKFLQVYANYHFVYFMKYIDKVEKDKLDQLKALKVTK